MTEERGGSAAAGLYQSGMYPLKAVARPEMFMRSRPEQNGASRHTKSGDPFSMKGKQGLKRFLVAIGELAADDVTAIIIEADIGVIPDVIPMDAEFQALEEFITGHHA